MPLISRGSASRLAVLVSSVAVLGAVASDAVAQTAAPPPPQRTRCAGAIAPVKGDGLAVGYAFRCRGEIESYTLVSSAALAGFEVNADVFLGRSHDPAQDDKAGCEGDIPAFGFSCLGSVGAGNTVSSRFEAARAPCVARGRWAARTMLIVAAPDGTISGPFVLRGPRKCKPARRAQRERRPATAGVHTTRHQEH